MTRPETIGPTPRVGGPHRSPIAFYYGQGRLEALAAFEKVVLQPSLYGPNEIAWLESRGTATYAYLSLGEDDAPPAPWHIGDVNADWGTAYVRPLHPVWVDSRVRAVESAADIGYTGLFIDTIDLASLYPELRADMLSLVTLVRAAAGEARVLANRGFSLLPELAGLVDGIVFESFSTAWTHASPGYRLLSSEELAVNSTVAHELGRFDLELYALDYLPSPELETFAKTRAALYGMAWFASNRAVDQLPEPPSSGGYCESPP
ncbi:MAG TPA: hypothetical protein VKY42_12410 [Trueperaceae bacterium]|jgi:hypothetical protein|nr:hypothetical protein [Trueperaceae bacterium]